MQCSFLFSAHQHNNVPSQQKRQKNNAMDFNNMDVFYKIEGTIKAIPRGFSSLNSEQREDIANENYIVREKYKVENEHPYRYKNAIIIGTKDERDGINLAINEFSILMQLIERSR